MPFREHDLPKNPVAIVLLAIGGRWLYGRVTGNPADSVQALVLWGMIAAVVFYVVILFALPAVGWVIARFRRDSHPRNPA